MSCTEGIKVLIVREGESVHLEALHNHCGDPEKTLDN